MEPPFPALLGGALLPSGGRQARRLPGVGGGVHLVPGIAALSSQVNQCLFTVPGTKQACPWSGALTLASTCPQNALLPVQQPFSHFPAFGPMSLPQESPPGLLCLKHLKQHLTPPSVLLSPITLLGSSVYLLIENIWLNSGFTASLPLQNVGPRRARSLLHASLDLKASHIVNTQKDLLKEWPACLHKSAWD